MRNAQHPFNGYDVGPDFDRARSQIATPFQYIDIALDVAATNQIFDVSGDFLYCDPDPMGSLAAGGLSKAGVAVIELNNQQNAPVAPFFVQPGFAMSALYKQIKLSWPAQPGKALRLMFSTGEQIVPTNTGNITGSVSVIDGGLTRTLLNQAFLGVANVGPVAAQYAHAQLYNPVASGKTLMLEAVSFSSSTGGQSIGMGGYNAAYSGGVTPWSKMIGGAVGIGQVRATNNAATLVTGTSLLYQVSASVIVPVNFREPVVILPGYAFCIVGLTANANLQGNFEWFEQ